MNETKDFKKKARRTATIDMSTMVYGKIPPQSRELEETVLGAIMLEKNAIHIAAEILKPASFYVDAHQKIYSAFLRLIDKNINVDILTTVEELKRTEELDIVGGPFAITKLTNTVTSSANLEGHCRYIQQKFLRRELIRISGETIAEAYDDSCDEFDIIDSHEQKLVDLTSGVIRGNFVTSDVAAMKAMQRIDFLVNNTDQLSGVPSGFPSIDRKTNGWQPTDLIILAARPSVGKTAFALNLALNAAKNRLKPTPVALFSLEMSEGQITNRILSTESKVGLEYITRGRLDDDQYMEVRGAVSRFSDYPVFIDDTAALNIFEFRAKARRLKAKHGVGLIIIDYLQLMSGMGGGNREQEISTISRNLKALAKELEIPIIALSQMSRAIEQRAKGSNGVSEPQLSDLRESGAIEQDADMVMFLYRPDYQQAAGEVDPSLAGTGMLKIAKHRNGDLDKIALKSDLSIQTWYDATEYPGPTNWKKIEPIIETIPVAVGTHFNPDQDTIPYQAEYNDIPPSDDVDDLPF